jgi:hypothetical protein
MMGFTRCVATGGTGVTEEASQFLGVLQRQRGIVNCAVKIYATASRQLPMFLNTKQNGYRAAKLRESEMDSIGIFILGVMLGMLVCFVIFKYFYATLLAYNAELVGEVNKYRTLERLGRNRIYKLSDKKPENGQACFVWTGNYFINAIWYAGNHNKFFSYDGVEPIRTNIEIWLEQPTEEQIDLIKTRVN